MTALAKRHKVRELVRSSSGKWHNMVYFLDGRYPSFFQATLTQRMLLCIQGTYPSPVVPVLLIVVRSPIVFVILLVPQCLMLLAIGLMRKVRTIGISTRLHWFTWHRPSSFCCSKKVHRIAPNGLLFSMAFAQLYNITLLTKSPLDTLGHTWSIFISSIAWSCFLLIVLSE